MPSSVSIKLETVTLDRLMGVVFPRAHAILDKASFDVERIAKPLSNIDTGAMRSSGYVSGASSGSTFRGGAEQARSLRSDVNIMPEERPTNEFERIVGFSVEYAYWQEMIKPYLVPATEQVRPQFIAAWVELLK